MSYIYIQFKFSEEGKCFFNVLIASTLFVALVEDGQTVIKMVDRGLHYQMSMWWSRQPVRV